MIDFQKDVNVFTDPYLVGVAAGEAVEKCIVELQERQDEIRIIFAAAPSQNGLLAYLSNSKKIKWHKIVAMNMDEYIGLPSDADQLFSRFLDEKLFSKVYLKDVNVIDTQNEIENEIKRYTDLINEGEIDIVCLGIGENGHIAFNDPPVADFEDSEIIKKVTLDDACKIQQVNDGCFESIDEVPKTALTLTVPILMKGKHLFCVVLGSSKSQAVKNTLAGPISISCPASILTTHPDCKFYFDEAAVKDLPDAHIKD
ncbi:6-phosphogluconolactonase [Belliella kenyensis]|uniref:6-phosphogluconolactonase n=1 Tax=Belliella kenyensis TaxID=1472724 RepID=A0ABV8ES44_9BACT|nr:6-phosphogluconolactonase [Belliella kenyensis]MCH7402003.1 6-phosphogluconolactonase [Belliella kenyensis]MDN3605167.1 6-phosphogluconolactonase [Belliella kenyensis]